MITTPLLPTRLSGDDLAITTSELRKAYGNTHALDGVDLTVPEGAVYLLVGPNGAGKTTMLKVLMDLARADRGSATVLGFDSRKDGPRLRAQVGYVPEGQRWEYGWMRTARLLEYHAAYFPAWDPEYARRLSQRLGLVPDREFGKLSKGQARRTQLVLALAHRPPVLLLDEPTDGLDPAAREQTLSVLADHLAEYPTTMLVSTHLVHEIQRLADHLGVLAKGRLQVQVPTELLESRMHRYRAEVPAEWMAPAELTGSIVHRVHRGRELVCVALGDEPEIRARLEESGATVSQVQGMSLEEVAICLLNAEEVAHVE